MSLIDDINDRRTDQGGRGQLAVYNTSPQTFYYQLWGLLMNFDWLIHSVECPNVSATNCNLQRG